MTSSTSLEQPIHTFYELISGYAGQPHDWDQLRALFVPGVKILPSSVVSAPGPPAAVNLDTYIERIAGFLSRNDFFEKGVIHQVEIYGDIASVISTYEARRKPDDPEPLKRGVNFIHLLHDGNRWLIGGMIWLDESPQNPLPEKYNQSNIE